MATILRNGRFFIPSTGATSHSFADCILIDNGTILHVGSEQDGPIKEASAQSNTTIQDMNKYLIIPGFIDSHMHILQTAEALQKLNVAPCKSLEQIRSAIRDYAKENPHLPRILCSSWSHLATDGNELASQLDDLDPRPIYIDADDLHSTWCSSSALEEMGVADMPDPPAGKIHRDENGKPSGLMSETAAVGIVWPFLSSKTTLEQKVKFVKHAFDVYVKAGYTGVVEMATDDGVWDVLQEYRKQYGELPFWIAAHWFIFPRGTEENEKQVNRAIEMKQKFNVENSVQCHITGIKVMCDGVVDACTAHLLEPYSHTNKNDDAAWTVETLTPVLKQADAGGLQCALHAIGDGAIRIAIDSLEAVGKPQARHRIEHLEMCSPEDVPRLGKLGITASVQPVHSDPAILEAWPKLIGPVRCQHVFPYGALAKHGALVAIGSDSPTAPFDPLPNLYAATTRRSITETERKDQTTPEFALDLAAAVTASTSGAAYSCFQDGRVGTLRKGLEANLAVVDMTWDATKLLQAKVVETWISGKKIFDAKACA